MMKANISFEMGQSHPFRRAVIWTVICALILNPVSPALARINVDYVATETFERRITQDSPASILQGNGGLLISAETLGNLYSVLASGGDLLLDTRYLVNVGATANTTIRMRTRYENSGTGFTASGDVPPELSSA